MGRLLLLIPTASYRVHDFLEAANRLGVEVAVGSNRRQVLEDVADGRTTTLDFRNPERGVDQIVAYARGHPLDAVVGVDDETILLAAHASEALGLPHNPPDAVAAARNKYRFRTRLANAGVPSPWFALFPVREDPARAAARSLFPCVLKPLALAASRGVIRADDPGSFVDAFRRIAEILKRPDAAADGVAADHILVEGYIPGAEVAVEGLLDEGRLEVLALFDKPGAPEGPFFEETIYVTPSRLPEGTQTGIVATARRVVGALGLKDGPVHAEFRVNDRGVWPIEMAPRTIGGLCSRALRFGAGVRLEELVLRRALRLPVASMEREERAAGVMMVPIPRAGVLREVGGLDSARAVPGVVEVAITIPVGQELVPLPEGTKYLGFIFAKGDSPDAAEAALREAHRRLDFVVEPPAGS